MHNKIIKNTNQWIVYIDDIMHVVDIKEENKLFVDNEYVGDMGGLLYENKNKLH